MKQPHPLVILISIIALPIVIGIGVSFIIDTGYSIRYTSSSINDSKARGAFINRVESKPIILKCNNKTIKIEDYWIEKGLKTYRVFSLFKVGENMNKYVLCIKPEKSFNTPKLEYWFEIKGSKERFDVNSDEVYFVYIKSIKPQIINVNLVKYYTNKDLCELKFIIK